MRSWNRYVPLSALNFNLLKFHVFDFNLTFDLAEWYWTWHVTHQNVRLNEMYTFAKYEDAICNRWKVMMLKLHVFKGQIEWMSCAVNPPTHSFNLTFDLEVWPWPWHFTPQNVWLDVTHMYAKYQIAICKSWILINFVKVGRKQTDGKNNMSSRIHRGT